MTQDVEEDEDFASLFGDFRSDDDTDPFPIASDLDSEDLLEIDSVFGDLAELDHDKPQDLMSDADGEPAALAVAEPAPSSSDDDDVPVAVPASCITIFFVCPVDEDSMQDQRAQRQDV